jgi:hypothetical protein
MIDLRSFEKRFAKNLRTSSLEEPLAIASHSIYATLNYQLTTNNA